MNRSCWGAIIVRRRCRRPALRIGGGNGAFSCHWDVNQAGTSVRAFVLTLSLIGGVRGTIRSRVIRVGSHVDNTG